MRVSLLSLLIASACAPAEPEPEDLAARTCEPFGLTSRAFITEGTTGRLRRDLAADFTLPTTTGPWSYRDTWSGCDSVVFLPADFTVSPLNSTSLLDVEADLVQLLRESDTNVHYVFTHGGPDTAAWAEAMDARLASALGQLGESKADWWADHTHVVNIPDASLDGWVADTLYVPQRGFAIDRFQRIRGLGGFSDVDRFSAELQQAGQWSWERNIAYAMHEVEYFNFESDREDELAATDWTIAYLFYDENTHATGNSHVSVELPTAEQMARFDTLQVDLQHLCDPSIIEFGNCDAWDAIETLYLCDADDTDVCDTEVARYITTYHREGRWLVDASQLIPLLLDGGTRRFRLGGTRSGHFNTVRLLFADSGAEHKPRQADYLWDGGTHNADYAANHPPITLTVPADAARVYLQATISGHGQGGDDNCAEFCNHEHTFTFPGGQSVAATHEFIGDQHHCKEQINQGTVPNQNGSWWFARTSWCPGKEVDPHIWDVTDHVTPGEETTITYTTNYPDVDDGSIIMRSWLTTWK